jgi:hypothetical protein
MAPCINPVWRAREVARYRRERIFHRSTVTPASSKHRLGRAESTRQEYDFCSCLPYFNNPHFQLTTRHYFDRFPAIIGHNEA